MNKFIGDVNDNSKRKRDAILAELDLELDDFTENESIEDEDELADDDSMNDAEELDDLNDSLFRELNKESNEFILNSF